MSAGDKSRWTSFEAIPYGSDHFFPTAPNYEGSPEYPDVRPFEPHPWLPSGIDDAPFAGDEVNGVGINWPREVWGWDSSETSRPTAMAGPGNTTSGLPEDVGQTVDVWVVREKLRINVPRDRNKVRAAGFRGTKE
jgi:hypothetical protein